MVNVQLYKNVFENEYLMVSQEFDECSQLKDLGFIEDLLSLFSSSRYWLLSLVCHNIDAHVFPFWYYCDAKQHGVRNDSCSWCISARLGEG